MKKYFLAFLISFVFQSVLFAQEKNINATGNDGKEITSPLCGGVERWAVKVLTDASAPQVNYTPKTTTLDSLIHISTSPNASAPRMAGIEFQSYTIKCNITIKKNEDDNDYHLVLQSGNETMIGEVPDPVCSVAASSVHVDEYIDARNWVNLNIGILPNSNVNLPLVDITGVSFVDVPHGQTGASPNQMEIHPILTIKFSGVNGINDSVNHAPAFKVSVNPSVFSESTTFHIISYHEMLGTCRLELFSITGSKVSNLNLPVTGNKEIYYAFNRSGLTNGLYIYRILNNNAILYEGKIIIQ